MKENFRKVLVAIREPDGSSAALLQKAAAIGDRDARIELVHVLTGPVSVAVSGLRQTREAVAQAMQAVAQRARQKLQRLARARETGADLVVAGAQQHRFGGRLLLVNTDWELIRETPCPVLLVKPAGRYRRGVVIAAIDPFHANDKPARLDARLLKVAGSLARVLGGEAHAFHAYVPLAALAPAMMMQPVPILPSANDEAAYRRSVQRTFDALAKRAEIPASHRHLRAGDVSLQLADVVRRTRAQIVVMGALSRSGMKRVFIGGRIRELRTH